MIKIRKLCLKFVLKAVRFRLLFEPWQLPRFRARWNANVTGSKSKTFIVTWEPYVQPDRLFRLLRSESIYNGA